MSGPSDESIALNSFKSDIAKVGEHLIQKHLIQLFSEHLPDFIPKIATSNENSQ